MTEPVMTATSLRRHYPIGGGWWRKGALIKAVEDVSFTLAGGQTLAIVGESGCGKSTLARMACLLETPDGGDLAIDGAATRDVPHATRQAQRLAVQMVFQNPYGSLNPRKTVGQALEEPLIINGERDRRQREDAARAMMAKVGLRPDHYGRYPHMFSGGQRQRIAIARALMTRPRIVVADEPVSALDVSIRAQVLNLMMDLQDEFGLAYLFISHDLSVVQHIANDVLVMYLGRVVEHGPKTAIFAKPRHPYTRMLLAATPTVEARRRLQPVSISGELPSPLAPPPGCAFHGRCPHATEICRSVLPPLRPIENRLVACHHAEEIS